MELTVHERNILEQPLSEAELGELLAGSRCPFWIKRGRVERPLR